MLLGAPLLPESPKWLIQRRRDEQAAKVIELLRVDDYDVQEEVMSLQNEAKQRESQIDSSESEKAVTWGDVFQAREAVVVGIGLMFISAATGINTVIFYSTT